MIISASRRTDIPAFFGEWFQNRVKAGFFYRVNPYNPSQVKAISLLPETVEALVFCTKNPRPFFKYLDLLDRMGYKYLFHYTLNDYPLWLEPAVPEIGERVAAFQELSGKIGARRLVWRYDPIILTTLTPVEYHLDKIAGLAKRLSGFTARLVISFLDLYPKVNGRFSKIGKLKKIEFRDVLAAENQAALKELCLGIVSIGKQFGMKVFTCAEALNNEKYGIAKGSCIDGSLLNEALGIQGQWKKDPYQRENCQCIATVDMGFYDTCQFGCAYCYACTGPQRVAANLRNHNPKGPALLGNYPDLPVEVVRNHLKKADPLTQLSLFGDLKKPEQLNSK